MVLGPDVLIYDTTVVFHRLTENPLEWHVECPTVQGVFSLARKK